MLSTFVGFSHLVSCQAISAFHDRLIDDVGHYWFFAALDPTSVVQNVLSIEDNFSWSASRIVEDKQEATVVVQIVRRILQSVKKVVCDAYDDDEHILKLILKKTSTFRFELLDLILDHRIRTKHNAANWLLGPGAYG